LLPSGVINNNNDCKRLLVVMPLSTTDDVFRFLGRPCVRDTSVCPTSVLNEWRYFSKAGLTSSVVRIMGSKVMSASDDQNLVSAVAPRVDEWRDFNGTLYTNISISHTTSSLDFEGHGFKGQSHGMRCPKMHFEKLIWMRYWWFCNCWENKINSRWKV